MTRGAYISGFGHGAFILWALFGGFFISARDPLPVQAADVSLISSEEFAALSLPNDAPIVPFDAPVPVEPGAPDDAPDIVPATETAPEPPKPVVVETPDQETPPVAPQEVLEPATDVSDQPPALQTPPEAQTSPDVAPSDDTPIPAPAPRVAPVAAAPPAPDVEIADTTAPEVVPDETADTVAEQTPATAPQEAATEIVTEAETPSSAPVVSVRPTARPARPVQVAAPVSDPVENAVAEAVASTAPDPVTPTGPPLTGSEKEGFRVAVGRCWNVDGGSAAARVTVTVGFSLDRSSKVVANSLKLIEATDGEARAVNAAYEAARRAIIRCGAKGFDLPLEKYSRWQNIEMTFNPEGMRIK
ncbi:MAG: energy transducer TonB [Paracoccaceae bacterium]